MDWSKVSNAKGGGCPLLEGSLGSPSPVVSDRPSTSGCCVPARPPPQVLQVGRTGGAQGKGGAPKGAKHPPRWGLNLQGWRSCMVGWVAPHPRHRNQPSHRAQPQHQNANGQGQTQTVGEDSPDVVFSSRDATHSTETAWLSLATASNAVPRSQSLSLEIDLASCPAITSCTPSQRPEPRLVPSLPARHH